MTVRPNDKVLYVGMNKFAAHEGKNLKKVAKASVTVVADSFENDKVRLKVGGKNKVFDLTTDAGRAGFVKTLGLPQAQADKISDVLKNAGADTRDELAQIATVWAKGELGGAVPNRLVLAGHSIGGGIYGKEGKWKNGSLQRDSIAALAAAMPKAAGQIEDLAISACFCGGQQSVDDWKAPFPNVKTVLAYDGLSPGAFKGATRHQKTWEKQTRGRAVDLTPEDFKGRRGDKGLDKDANVAIWNTKDGYLVSTPWETTAELRTRRTDFAAELAKYNSGELATPSDPDNNPLRTQYRNLHQILNRSEVTGAERAAVTEEKDLVIRLIKYPKVAKTFVDEHKAALKAGYDALGLKQPSPGFDKMTRKDALAAIADFDRALAASKDQPQAAKTAAKLLGGLRDLDSKSIDETWIG